MIVIGLTGTIGSGKSTIASFMQELGANYIDADKIGHQSYLPNSIGWQKVTQVFGDRILASDKSIDRQKLGEIVFSDHTALEQLNSIMHPIIFDTITAQLDELWLKPISVVVLEVLENIFLFEPKWKNLVNEIWVTHAPDNIIQKRLIKYRHLSLRQIEMRMKNTIPFSEAKKYASRIIDTNIPLEELRTKITAIWDEVLFQNSQQ